MPRDFDKEAADEARAAERINALIDEDPTPTPKPTTPVDLARLRTESLVAAWLTVEVTSRLDQMKRDAKLLRSLAEQLGKMNMAKFYAGQDLAAWFERDIRNVEQHFKERGIL